MPSTARVVTVEEGSGAGLLVSQGGNCFVILPTHVHGRRRDGIRLGSERASGAIGTAKIVHVVPGDADISLGLVRGGLAQDCGTPWSALPRRLDDQLVPGTLVILRRPRQRVREGRRLLIESAGFRKVQLVPPPGEAGDLFGGTSGAVAFLDDVPIGMVLQSADTSTAIALRMDEIVALLSRFLGSTSRTTTTSEGPSQGAGLIGDPIEAVSWTAHPVEGAVDPAGMLAGQGPWIFELGDEPVQLVLLLAETDRLKRILLQSTEGPDTSVPRRITITSQASSDPNRPRSADLPAPEMTPDGHFELRVGERFAKQVTITIHSSWGGGSKIRLDRVVID